MCSATALSLASAWRFRPCSAASPARRQRGVPEDDVTNIIRSAALLRATPSSRQRTAGGLKPPPRGFVGWKSKPISPWRRGKASDQDPGTGEIVEQIDSIGAFEQTEQIGATQPFQARAADYVVEPPPLCGKQIGRASCRERV